MTTPIRRSIKRLGLNLIALGLGACASTPQPSIPAAADSAQTIGLASAIRRSLHQGDDDLLTAGLGLPGLRQPLPPALALDGDPASTASALRRRAFYANWRGIADLASGHGLGPWSAALPPVPGVEFQAFARLPGRQQTQRVLAQIPDAYDQQQRCLVVAAASGSRGVYGAIAVAGPWALARGCAVVHTDKGAGTGVFDLSRGEGVDLDGRRATEGLLEFNPGTAASAAAPRLAFKQAHGGENSEADWGRQVLQAARFGLLALNQAFPSARRFTAANTRIIAVGISNGGGAVLRAAEQDDSGLFDAVVAGEPNITAPGARPLFDYVTEAALFGPCAMAAVVAAPTLLPTPARTASAQLRCASLHAAGLLATADFAEQPKAALAEMRNSGWSDDALALTELNVAFDLWRAITATYTQAYARVGAGQPVCGYGFAVLDANGNARAATDDERRGWWSDGSGIAPTTGIGIVDALATGADPTFAGLWCARGLWQGTQVLSAQVRASIAATTATARPLSPNIFVLHGRDDAMIPIAFSSRPYVLAVRANGIAIDYQEIDHAQHFDAFLALPTMARYQATLPEVYQTLDRAWAAVLASESKSTSKPSR